MRSRFLISRLLVRTHIGVVVKPSVIHGVVMPCPEAGYFEWMLCICRCPAVLRVRERQQRVVERLGNVSAQDPRSKAEISLIRSTEMRSKRAFDDVLEFPTSPLACGGRLDEHQTAESLDTPSYYW